MSSIVTADFVPGCKLFVHVAENGHTFELNCDESTPVESVQRCLESLSDICYNDQLLLCVDTKLESRQSLSFYKLPCDDREVFLYNRARILPDSPLPLPEQFDVDEITDPPSPSSSQDPHPLDDASDPALKALPSYERQFRYHFQLGNRIYGCTQAKFRTCERLLREKLVQERALETAKGNMDHYFRMIKQMYTDFMKCFAQQHRCHLDILMNFGSDIERLRLCKLHPGLQTESRKCLIDFVKVDNLRKWAANCASSHRQFEMKVSQLKAMFAELKRRIQELFSNKASIRIRDVEFMIKDHHCYLNEQKCIMQSLSKDVDMVKKLVDDCLSCQVPATLRPHDAVSALGPMYDVHDKTHLPKMQASDHSVSKLLDFCKGKKNEMNLFVHNSMQKIAYIQSIIRDIRLQFPAFKEAMVRQDDIFEDLKLVRGIGPAYRACLAEVVRRKSSMKLYMGLAGQLAERLAMKREVEIRKRDEFIKAQGAYVPRDILVTMGLFDSPSQCDVNIVPFDTNLLNIDIMDIDRYASESLVGMCSKSKNETEGNSIDSRESYDSEELLEVCGSVEIAGTTKIEVENAWLKAELASAIAATCLSKLDVGYDSLDESKLDNLLKNMAEKTAEALRLKDEYGENLKSVLKMKQMQCLSYEKRIRELEQRLSDQYLHGKKLSSSKDASELFGLSSVKSDDCKSEICGEGDSHMPYVSTEPMDDEVSSTPASLDLKLEQFAGESSKPREGVDENMMEQVNDFVRKSMDASMMEQLSDKVEHETTATLLGLTLTRTSSTESLAEPLNAVSCKTDAAAIAMDGLLLELQSAPADKSNKFSGTEIKLKDAMEEVAILRKEMEISQKLLDESQMNCAHLENCLHEAREEAHTNLFAANRRASEYSTLRASAVKLRGLFERLRSCITASGGVADFVDTLQSLALSLSSSSSANEDDGTAEFRACISVLADKVGILSRQHAEVLDRCLRAEAAHGHLAKELGEKEEVVKSLYAKHQLEKRVNKEKISFGRFEVHELAAFVLNSTGHYEAINRNCSNYFLSTESIALFVEDLPCRPNYIIGPIVHIERKTVIRADQADRGDPLSLGTTNQVTAGSAPASNPYNLPVGCEYFIVTVAMLPNTIFSPP